MNPTAAPTTSAQALGNLESFQNGLQTPDAIINSTNQGLGVDAAQSQVSGLRQAINNTTNLINQVAPSVYGRTQGSLVTDAQATHQISNEQQPLNTTLGKENTDYGNQEQDYQDLLGKASTLAQAKLSGQNTEEGYLQNIYSNLYGQEKDAATAQQAKDALAEQAREADLQAATTRAGQSSAGSGISLGGSGASSGGSAPTASMSAKSGGGGFNFTSASGAPISAASYAAATGQDIGSVLYAMGKAGDTYAQQAYNEIKANQSFYNSNPNTLKTEFSSLFWGT